MNGRREALIGVPYPTSQKARKVEEQQRPVLTQALESEAQPTTHLPRFHTPPFRLSNSRHFSPSPPSTPAPSCRSFPQIVQLHALSLRFLAHLPFACPVDLDEPNFPQQPHALFIHALVARLGLPFATDRSEPLHVALAWSCSLRRARKVHERVNVTQDMTRNYRWDDGSREIQVGWLQLLHDHVNAAGPAWLHS